MMDIEHEFDFHVDPTVASKVSIVQETIELIEDVKGESE
jgi:acyl carrier protein